jgi:hypothetical protein
MIMKNCFRVSVLFIALSAVIVLSSGCSHPGKTNAEVHRDHVRTMQTNQQELMQDLDRAVLIDKPSRLTDKKIP